MKVTNEISEQGRITAAESLTTWERVSAPFRTRNSPNDISPAAILIAKMVGTTFGTVFIWTALLHRRVHKGNFLDRNQITLYESNIQAKRKLLDNVVLECVKSGTKQAFKYSLFTGCMLITMVGISGYRQKHGPLNFALGAGLTGIVFKANYGVRGMLVSGSLAGILGYTSGLGFFSLLKLKGLTFEDLLKQQGK